MLKMLLVFLLYLATAKFGLSFDAVSGFATLVWAPTGIALSAMIIFGLEMWPAVFLAAFLVNLSTGAAPFVALAIGAGNSLEAVVGTLLLRRVGFRPSLERVRDVILFILCGVIASTIVSATVGTLSLWLGKVVDATSALPTWLAWWVGDMLGALIVGALILAIQPIFASQDWRNTSLAKVLKVVFVFATLIIFNYFVFFTFDIPVLIYLLFPILVWTALEFEVKGAVCSIFFTSVMAIWATVESHGPFAGESLSQALLLLQIFMGSLSLTILILAANVVERVRAFQVLEKIDKAKSEFVSIASHQLRTPLTTVKWYIKALLGGRRGIFTEEQNEYMAEVENANQKMITLVNTLLNVSRIELGTFQVSPISSVVVRKILSEVIEEFDHLIKAKKLKIETHYSEKIFPVHADPALIQIVFQNLLSNSIKYSPEGSTIQVDLSNNGHEWLLEVKDAGFGIPRSEQALIFSKLFRANNAQALDPEGSGLGLYIVKSIAEQVGGRIWFESELNRGSTFHVAFPMQE